MTSPLSYQKAYQREQRRGTLALLLWLLAAVLSPQWMSGWAWLAVYVITLGLTFLMISKHWDQDAIRYRAHRRATEAKPL